MDKERRVSKGSWMGTWAVVALSAAGLFAQREPNPVVVVQTNVGDITIELYRDRAPKSVENFLDYANSGFYGGTIFHRVIRDFMIQGGGLTPQLRQKPTNAPIINEAMNGLKNQRGTVAMARTGGINTATSQFFINTKDNTALDHKGMTAEDYGYAVFGRVIAGMDVVDKIAELPRDARDKPHDDVVIEGVSVSDRPE